LELGRSVKTAFLSIHSAIDGAHKNIILDLGGVTFLDSSGLGSSLGYATAVSRGSEIRLLNLNKRVYDLMQITKLYTVFDLYRRSNGGQEFRSGGSISVEAGVALRTLLVPWLQCHEVERSISDFQRN
jgi:anti-sigma B factor antagonist